MASENERGCVCVCAGGGRGGKSFLDQGMSRQRSIYNIHVFKLITVFIQIILYHSTRKKLTIVFSHFASPFCCFCHTPYFYICYTLCNALLLLPSTIKNLLKGFKIEEKCLLQFAIFYPLLGLFIFPMDRSCDGPLFFPWVTTLRSSPQRPTASK